MKNINEDYLSLKIAMKSDNRFEKICTTSGNKHKKESINN